MAWRRPDPAVTELFARLIPDPPQAERRKMFGCLAGFTQGKMFGGVHQETIVLRLGEADRQEFLKLRSAKLFVPFPGRKMREFVVVPPEILANERKLKGWIGRALEYARSLPRRHQRAKPGGSAKRSRR